MASPSPNPLQALLGAGAPAQGEVMPAAQSSTPLLDALISRGLGERGAQEEIESATPLEGYPQLPNPDPNSSPPLYGEPPGEGYLYARDPGFRQAALVSTTPDLVRAMLLRSMETLAFNLMLPFNEEKANGSADAILKCAQAYLLIDPEVDQEGVPVAAKAALTAATQAAGSAGEPQAAPSASGGAHGSVKRAKAVGGYQPPPRVLPGAAGQAVQALHENAQALLQDSRGSRPLPRPRPAA